MAMLLAITTAAFTWQSQFATTTQLAEQTGCAFAATR